MSSSSDGATTVAHVVPRDLARGAQVYARALADHLTTPQRRHVMVCLFSGAPAVLRPDLQLGVRAGVLRRAGYDPRVAVRLRPALRRLAPDIVVSHGGEALLYTAAVMPPSAALVHKRIGVVNDAKMGPGRRALHRAALHRADAIVAVSQETLDETRQLFGIPSQRLHLVPNGRDPEVYRPADGARRREAVRVIWVGELDANKRPELLVSAVARLRAERLDIHAQMVGQGPLEGRLRAAAGQGVELLGRRADVPALLADADVFCLSSVAEGMPGVLIEAGLAGLPSVATDAPGVRAVIDDGVTGLVVGGDEAAVAGALRLLATDPDRRAAMGAAARRRCLERFTIEVSARRWQEVFDEVSPRRR